MLRRIKHYPFQVLLLFLFVGILLSLMPLFDYHQFLLPLPDDAAMHCHLGNITKENVVVSIGNHGDPTMKHFVAGINLRKVLECRSTRGASYTFLYQNVYTGVSRDDVDTRMRETIEKYKTVRNRWRYLLSSVGQQKVDRHGFSEIPLNPYENYWFSFIMMKFFILFFTTLIVLLLLSVPCCQRLFPLREAVVV